jgi:peptidoglycan hydrolase CwlO-like protein
MTEKYTLEELLELEETMGNRLTQLSKNASKNKGPMERLMSQMKELDTAIEMKKAEQVTTNQSALQPQRDELLSKQAGINAKIERLSKEPSRYGAKIQELGKASKAIDEQLEELTHAQNITESAEE